ncbi:MAG TPA: PEP-CTERM sorting domain-containing protein [Dongiaceae bacterium]|jgi:hypothetical protein|nr:PEP-CTERM sorting domain-containing protein [Dongiaceae bacterium]
MKLKPQKKALQISFAVLGVAAACVSASRAATIYAAGTAAGPSGDAPTLANSDNTATEMGSWETWIGGANWVSSGTVQTSVIMGFQLPSLGAVSNPFGTATLGVNYFGTDNGPTFNVDLYGLGTRANSTALGSDYFGGSLDSTPGVTLLTDNIITPSTPHQNADDPAGTFSSDISLYLNTMYANGANAGQFVMFRFSADVTGLNSSSDLVYHLETNPGNGTPNDLPQITYTLTAVPEPATVALLGVAGAALLLRKRR